MIDHKHLPGSGSGEGKALFQQQQQQEKDHTQQKIMGMDNRKGGPVSEAVKFGKFPVKYAACHCKNGIQ